MSAENVTLHDAQQYVGMPYIDGVFDCADLSRKVQWEVFGRLIALPEQRPRPSGARGQARAVQALRDDVAERIDAPVTGCGVLLWEPDGEAGQDLRRWHIGNVFMHGGEVWVLHNSHALGSAHLQRLTELRMYGLRLDGFYEWKVRA